MLRKLIYPTLRKLRKYFSQHRTFSTVCCGGCYCEFQQIGFSEPINNEREAKHVSHDNCELCVQLPHGLWFPFTWTVVINSYVSQKYSWMDIMKHVPKNILIKIPIVDGILRLSRYNARPAMGTSRLKTLSTLLTLCDGNPSVTDGCRASNAALWCFVGTKCCANSRCTGNLRRNAAYVTSLGWDAGIFSTES